MGDGTLGFIIWWWTKWRCAYKEKYLRREILKQCHSNSFQLPLHELLFLSEHRNITRHKVTVLKNQQTRVPTSQRTASGPRGRWSAGGGPWAESHVGLPRETTAKKLSEGSLPWSVPKHQLLLLVAIHEDSLNENFPYLLPPHPKAGISNTTVKATFHLKTWAAAPETSLLS